MVGRNTSRRSKCSAEGEDEASTKSQHRIHQIELLPEAPFRYMRVAAISVINTHEETETLTDIASVYWISKGLKDTGEIL